MSAPARIDPRLAEALAYPALVIAERDRRKCVRLIEFVRTYWHIVEPHEAFREGWAVEAMCDHLEAVTAGLITRLLINVPPGSMKSLLVNVFWPAWEWGPMGQAHLRYVAFSYAALLTERDNRKFLAVVSSQRYQAAWGHRVVITKASEGNVINSATGSKLATSVGGVGTGERGNRILLDDPHNVKDTESDIIRKGTVEWFRTAMSNRLNNIQRDAIVGIMQRTHDEDVSGAILSSDLGYDHLMIPAEFEADRAFPTSIGWRDPRTEEGESYWPERYPLSALATLATTLGPYAYAGQYQQRPEIKGAGIIAREDWKFWLNPDDPDDPRYRKYPPFEIVVASFDGAFSEKQTADYSALSIWGLWRDDHMRPQVMLASAWAERLTINGAVTKIVESCQRLRVSVLLVENKASGISVQQELARLQGDAEWSVFMIDPKKHGDKVARAHSVAHLFAAGMVWAPDRAWSDKVITQCAAFPRGAHDDLVDTTTQALRWMRDAGLLVVQAEREAEIAAGLRNPPRARPPLYPV